MIRHMTMLIVRGLLQSNVDQTFSPVLNFTTIRTCVAVSVQKSSVVEQMDIKTTFLHDEIYRDV